MAANPKPIHYQLIPLALSERQWRLTVAGGGTIVGWLAVIGEGLWVIVFIIMDTLWGEDWCSRLRVSDNRRESVCTLTISLPLLILALISLSPTPIYTQALIISHFTSQRTWFRYPNVQIIHTEISYKFIKLNFKNSIPNIWIQMSRNMVSRKQYWQGLPMFLLYTVPPH